MKGFIKNETNRAFFKLQRPVPVNGKISFDNAYLTLGEKSKKPLGSSFVKWLRDNTFKDQEEWVFYKEEDVLFFKSAPEIKEKEPKVGKGEPEVVVSVPKVRKKKSPSKGAGKKLTRKKEAAERMNITPSSIIEASIEEAKSLIEKTKDRAVLKKALSLANHFSKKEEHRRLVQKRLEEVY